MVNNWILATSIGSLGVSENGGMYLKIDCYFDVESYPIIASAENRRRLIGALVRFAAEIFFRRKNQSMGNRKSLTLMKNSGSGVGSLTC